MPNYFSATNCRASGEVLFWGNVPGTSTARYLLRAELWVGGELAREWDRDPGDNNIQNLLAVMFDSTHFEHGTWVEVHAPCHEQGEPMGVQAIKEIYRRKYPRGRFDSLKETESWLGQIETGICARLSLQVPFRELKPSFLQLLRRSHRRTHRA